MDIFEASREHFKQQQNPAGDAFSIAAHHGKRATLEIPLTSDFRCPEPSLTPGMYTTAFEYHDEQRLSLVFIPESGGLMRVLWTRSEDWHVPDLCGTIEYGINRGFTKDMHAALAAFSLAEVMGGFR